MQSPFSGIKMRLSKSTYLSNHMVLKTLGIYNRIAAVCLALEATIQGRRRPSAVYGQP